MGTAPDSTVSTLRPLEDDRSDRIAALERQIAAQQALITTLQESNARLTLLSEATFEGIILHRRGVIVDTNQAMSQICGYDLSELRGMIAFNLVVPECRDLVKHNVVTHYELPYEVVGLRKDGSTFPAEIVARMIGGDDGELRVAAVRDITERRRLEADRQRLQEELIETQARALAELSTPLIPISDSVMVMPLIGSIDSRRAQQVLEVLLQGISENAARVAILDVTGVPLVDTAVANALVRAAQAVQLLGARMVLTGIRPEVAQTLVGLGVDLHGIITRSTLQGGISYALGLQRA